MQGARPQVILLAVVISLLSSLCPVTPKQRCENCKGIWVPDDNAPRRLRDYKGRCIYPVRMDVDPGCPDAPPSGSSSSNRDYQVIVFRDLNGDGWIKKADGEIWCEEPENPGVRVRCTFLGIIASRMECENEGGTWEDAGNGTYFCMFADYAVVASDSDADSILSDDEYHCESLDENGRPSGTLVTCPFDEIELPQE